MRKDITKAVVDADFFIKLTEHGEQEYLFLKILEDLGIEPIMHCYVYEEELRKSAIIKSLVQKKKIKVYDYSDYITEENKDEYEEYFYEAYERFNGFEFDERQNLYKYHAVKESLGEIRSLYMAKELGIPYFMSDDSGLKYYVKKWFSSNKHSIEIVSIYEALLWCKERGTDITWKDLNPTITVIFRERRKKLEEIKRVYTM